LGNGKVLEQTAGRPASERLVGSGKRGDKLKRAGDLLRARRGRKQQKGEEEKKKGRGTVKKKRSLREKQKKKKGKAGGREDKTQIKRALLARRSEGAGGTGRNGGY